MSSFDVPDDAISVIWSVHREMAGRDEAEILTALSTAGISGPADALVGLARRISATDRSRLPPAGVPLMRVRARFAQFEKGPG